MSSRPQPEPASDPDASTLRPSLERVPPERLGSLLELALLPEKLLQLCRALGLSEPGYRLEKLAPPDHASLLADEYRKHARSRPQIEDAVAERIRAPALATSWVPPVAARELVELVSGDPLLSLARLAWRFSADEDPSVHGTTGRAIDAGASLLEAVDDEAERTKKPAPRPARASDANHAELEKRASRAEREREATRAQLQQARGEIAERDLRLNELKGELSALQLEKVRQELELSRLSASRHMDERKSGQEARRIASERSHLERRIETLEHELEQEQRRVRELEKARQEAVKAPAQAPATEPETDAGAGDFHVPHFTREFYESLEGWDRRVVKSAFEKAMLLARDHRHPSLRAVPLEGMHNYFRIRIASDVRLIYRRGDGGGVDLLSLIDREDLDRYVRQAKTRRED